MLEQIFEKVKPFLSPAGIAALEAQGTAVWFEEADEWGTPLVQNGPCAYMVMDQGVAACGIEKAWRAGAVDFRKPISSHLYTNRVEKNEDTCI